MPREVCGACGTIHYRNPKIVVGCLPVWEDRVLLCRRAIEPRLGLWTLPAGFMENGETLPAGAMRETLEEAGARVDVGQLYTVISLPQINQVYVMFRSRLARPRLRRRARRASRCALFAEDEIPWERLAFRTITRTLRRYFLDRREGAFPLRVSALARRGRVPPDLAGAA